MKKLKLFFALFAMLALGVGNAWGATATITFSEEGLTNGQQYSNPFEIDANTTITFAGGDNDGKYYTTGSGIRTYAGGTIAIACTNGTISEISFTWSGSNKPTEDVANPTGYSTSTGKWTGSASSVTLTRPSGSGHWRLQKVTVTYETSGGGETPGEGGGEDPVVPNPDPEEPGTGGESLSYTWDLSKKTYSAASNTQVTWSATDVNMVADKGTAGTAPNNYLGGDANNRTSSRFYQNSILTITPEANVTITSVVFTATSDSYATALKNSAWTNATATASSKTVTVTPTNGASAISAKIGATCGFTGVTVNYTKAASDAPEPVIVKTLKSIEVTGMTTTYEQGDVFKFDGTCTATYSVTKDGAAQADEKTEVTPASVSTPDMNQIGTQTITVTYETVSTTYDITIIENEVTAGAYNVLLNNELWNVTAGQQAASVESMTGKSNDITFYTTKGSSQMYASATQTRFYNGATFVISVPNGYVIKSIVFTEPTSDKKWEGNITANTGTYTNETKTWTGSAQEVQFGFGAQDRIANASITFEAVDLTLPSAPTFDPVAGTYNAIQNVTISAEAGTTIYYTLDGTDPTTASNVYASAIEISETTTVKAIAVKDEKISSVASATYTINLPLTTMDQIFAKATAVGSTATSVEITFDNWVVSAVKEDGKTAFVTEGTKGFVIYEASCGFNVGDVLSGTAACKVLLYNGFAELTGLTSATTGLTVTTGGTVNTQELDAAGIAALTGINTGSLIKINGTCTSESSKYYVADVQIYTSLYDFGTLEVGAEYNITGIYQPYNATKEMLPRSAADIEKVVGLPTATISIADITMEIGQEKTIEATITPDAAQTKVQYAITAGNEYIDLDGTTITAVAAGTATITATIAEVEGEYYGTTKTFNVTVKPQNIAVLPFTFNGGKTDIENTLGMSQTGLDDDYGSAPKLKFNGAGDNVIVHFDSQAGEFSFVLKQNGQNAGTFTVYESANGEDYTPIWSGGNIGNTKSETITPTLAESSRYVKFEYTTKGEGTNYALGSISIAKPDFRQEAGLVWSVESVILNQGDAFTAPTLSNDNGLTLTCSSTDESVATVTSEGIITLAGAIGTTTITASFAGNEYYKVAEVSCKITVNKAQLPTGTFALYSGDIVEGDYVITYENYAMNTTSSAAPRLQYQEVTPTENKLVNPANQIVWHIAADGEYWTLYNNYDEVYAVSTGVKNQATTAAEVNDNAKWSVLGDDTYDFVNYERENSTTDNNNKYLRRNNEHGFACYAQATGGELTLYRKQTPHTVTVAACTNGSVSASGVVDTKALSGDIITLSNTPEFDYQFVGYNVYKTGDETTVITVTNGTFTMPAFDVTISATFEAIQPTTKTLSGKFSTGEYEYAEFATGNLQHNPKSGDWRFAKQQYQVVGEANINVGDPNYKGWIDMFGWSNGEANIFGVNPSFNKDDYNGKFENWGSKMGEGWLTLTDAQWNYLLYQRANASMLKQIAMVGETRGIMLFPDDWTKTTVDATDDAELGVKVYKYDLTQWTALESAGAVFLPAAGRRFGGYGNTVQVTSDGKTALQYGTNYFAAYWTSTKHSDGERASYLINLSTKGENNFVYSNFTLGWYEYGYVGQSVRLAKVTIKIGDGNNSAVITENAEKTVNVQVNREFKANDGYYTICLPFNLDAKEIGEALQISSITKNVKDEGINVVFTKAETLLAGQPYLVLPSEDLTDPIFENVTIVNTTGETTEPVYGAGIKITFTGIINGVGEKTDGKTEYYVGNEGKLYKGTVDKLGLRAFFTITDANDNPVNVRARVVTREDAATGFENITNGENTTIKLIENGQLIIIRNGEKFNAQGVRL